jgi:hypothetical protein
VETRNDASKTSCEIDNRNQLEKRFISSQAFHRTPGGRVRKTTTGEKFKPIILESFDPATQELYRHLPTIIHTRIETLEEVSEDFSSRRRSCSCLFLRTGSELTEQKNLRRDQHLAQHEENPASSTNEQLHRCLG